jgi:hypothetical protein
MFLTCEARADVIDAGFDLFDPLSGSQIFVPALGRLVPIIGVTIPSFPAFGTANLGNTNSILHRDNSLSSSGPLTTPVEMQAMQLMSTDGSNLFFTVQAAPPSAGTLSVIFGPSPNSGTFTWDIDVFFNVATGSFGGPLFTSFDADLTAGPTPWSHVSPPGAVCIPGLNCLLNGTNATDFFPTGNFTVNGPNGTSIIFGTAVVPEPATVLLVSTGLIAIVVRRRTKRSQQPGG